MISLTPERRRFAVIAFSLMLLVAVLDQWSKLEVLAAAEAGRLPVAVTSFFNLILVWNRGVSFGMMTNNHTYGPLLLTGLAVALMGLLLYWLWNATHVLQASAIGFILGGAVGNVIDRQRYGAVVDFLDVYWQQWHWSAFNVADGAICIGVVLLVLESIVVARPAAAPKGGEDTPPEPVRDPS